MAKKIDWKILEDEFSPLHGKVGRPSVPISIIVGLLLLKQMYNLGDETVVERYLENPYWQHFCGEVYFQNKLPLDPSDFVHFRKCIGEKGMNKIFMQSVDLFGKEKVRKEVKEVRVNATIQEKNITFPTDRKLTEKVIEQWKRIAKEEDIKLTRTFGWEIKKLKQQQCFARKPKNMTRHKKAQRRLHRITFKIYQDVTKQLNTILGKYMEELDVLYRILTQKRDDTNKVYRVHEPGVLCISKGK